MAPFQLLCQLAPAWIRKEESRAPEWIGEATVNAPGAASDWHIRIAIAERDGAIQVREEEPGHLLPRFCPQRHINEDQSFCLGYRAGQGINNSDTAIVWWGLLHYYLVLQRVASRTRRWPPRQALSHGDAGEHQLKAQHAAKQLAILDQYLDMLEGAPHWLTSRHIRLNKNRDGLINGRARCPIGCVRSKGKPRLRRECCHKGDLVDLVRHERQREIEERAFWKELRKRNAKCCGTMDHCPL